jgi:GTP-binding protein
VAALGWDAPWHLISAAERAGTTELCEAVMNYLEARARIQAEDPEAARHEREMQEAMQREARERIAWLQAQRTGADDELVDKDEDADDDHDVEVFYAP